MREPYLVPDVAGDIDKPEDELAELLEAAGVPESVLWEAIQAIHEAAKLGILERMTVIVGNRTAHELIKRVLALIGDSPNAALRVWCLDFLAGTNLYGGRTERMIAREWGCTPSNVSRIVKELEAMLGTHAALGGKSKAACRTYAERARRNHAEGKIKKPVRPYLAASFYEWIDHRTEHHH